MKLRSRLLPGLLAAGCVVLLAGCASMPATTASSDIDYDRIARIERAARAFGTQVIWVNYPTRRTEAIK